MCRPLFWNPAEILTRPGVAATLFGERWTIEGNKEWAGPGAGRLGLSLPDAAFLSR